MIKETGKIITAAVRAWDTKKKYKKMFFARKKSLGLFF